MILKKFSSLFIYFLIFFVGTLSLTASKPDVRSRLYSPGVKGQSFKSRSGEPEVKYVPVILELEDDEDFDEEMAKLQAVVFHRRGQLVLASVPEDSLDHLFHSGLIDRISCARQASRNVDVARRVSGVDMLHAGITLNNKTSENLYLDGTGVLTGIVDMGFDPSHIAFRDRLIYWSIYDEEKASKTEMDSPEAIRQSGINTDVPGETHATHVGNILFGGYKDAPYYGVAPGSKFAVSTSTITDVGILAGIEDIIAVAEREELPCVINVSCGSYLGPHDGTDLFNRYLDALNDRAVICFSSGNYGKRDISFDITLDEKVKGCTWCDSRKWDGFRVTGSSDFWSDTDDRFEFQYAVYDCNEKKYIYESEWYGAVGDSLVSVRLDSVPELKGLFSPGSGYMISWGVDPNNNRFSVSADYDSETQATQTAGPWARYFTGFRIKALDKKVRVRAWADGISSFFHRNGVPDGIFPSKESSATNFANGEAGIVVGAWNSRNITPVWGSDEPHLHGYDVNQVAEWSASGETFYGRKLPDICGPGNILVSAMSSYCLDSPGHPAPAAETDSYYWFAEAGTSMSSPVVAGIIALWKQYYPDLTTAMAREILTETANRNFGDIENPRWGAGAVDAVAGFHRLVKMVNDLGVNNVVVDRSRVEYYTLQGRRLESLDNFKDNIVIESYYDSATGKRYSRKILIR